MGRMEQQLPDKVKQQRVEELMLAQQEVVFARNESRIGQTVDAMIEQISPGEKNVYVARTPQQAPDIDSVVFVSSRQKLACGEIIQVKITDYKALRPDRRSTHAKKSQPVCHPVLIRRIRVTNMSPIRRMTTRDDSSPAS
ncbi:MAG: hypothetical protein KatS3mg104_2703 [Phycisphaerae bacterium]|nr:MAG: hypothetical protein KatS3mg104_2703 [Phycisphaerae bacterium]